MNILICGASGFVGRHLLAGLCADGHNCRRGLRRPQREDDVAIDYLRDIEAQHWLPRLRGVDAVINAVGILRDSRTQPMDRILAAAPSALFRACAAGVERLVNISALGVEGPLPVPYFQRRREAEAVLFSLPARVRRLNLRPSAIYGEDGASARLFRRLAALPLHALPMGGGQRLQPVHVDDIVAAVRRWLADPEAPSLNANAAGAEVATLREMLDSYREQSGKRPAWHLSLPARLVRLGARAGDLVPPAFLCSDTLAMLEAGNTGDNTAFAALLGREPLSYRQFITGPTGRAGMPPQEAGRRKQGC